MNQNLNITSILLWITVDSGRLQKVCWRLFVDLIRIDCGFGQRSSEGQRSSGIQIQTSSFVFDEFVHTYYSCWLLSYPPSNSVLLSSSVSKCVWISYQIWIIFISRPGHSRRLPHHLLNILAVDLWDESRLPPRLRGSRLSQFSASIDRKVLQLLTQIWFNRKYWHWRSQQTHTTQHSWPAFVSSGENWTVLHFHTLLFILRCASWIINKCRNGVGCQLLFT